ncbi:MAG TPA: hypothetical protein VMW16_12965 [Sedimentisphaerales bacterium]|nr:hypothetical protein [Sedimentisphaerales bacterium]
MNKLLQRSVLIVICTSIPDCVWPKDKDGQSEIVICEKRYKAVSVGDEKELGRYYVKAVTRGKNNEIEIVEQMTMDYRDKKAGYSSTVVYGCEPQLFPLIATVETTIDGKTCMKGQVRFSKTTLSISGVGFFNKKTGAAIEPPFKFEQKDIPIPKGFMLFQSAFQVLGPKCLQTKGELKDIVFVEFPDDLGAPELINMKEGYRMVREQADDTGSYQMRILDGRSDAPVVAIQFDKKDRVTSMWCFGKMKLVEVDRNKP